MLSVASSPSLKSVRIGILSPMLELDPRRADDDISGLVLAQIFEPPFALRGGTDETIPLLFAEPLRLEDSTPEHPVYSSAVRSSIRFSDGTPLTAECIAHSLRGSPMLQNKVEIEARGDRVFFYLKSPNARFDLSLTQKNCSIVLETEHGLFGTGAFRFPEQPSFHSVRTARELKLIRNSRHRQLPPLEELHFEVFPAEKDGAPTALAEAFRDGLIDLTSALHLSHLRRFALGSAQVSFPPENCTGILFFNTARNVLSSTTARKGIIHAIDLLEIAQCCFERDPIAFVAGSVLPPMMSRYSGFPRPNRDEARRLLATLGNNRPRRLTLLVPWTARPYLPNPLPVAETLRRQLAEVDINVSLIETESSERFFSLIRAGQFDMALAGWIADTPDPADFLESLLWSKMSEGDNHSNHSRWRNAQMDAALLSFRMNPSETKLSEILRLVRDEAPFLPLMYGQSIVVHSRRLHNLTLTADGVALLAAADLRDSVESHGEQSVS
jgi:peptide/nickel transport system substrate-binding protein